MLVRKSTQFATSHWASWPPEAWSLFPLFLSPFPTFRVVLDSTLFLFRLSLLLFPNTIILSALWGYHLRRQKKDIEYREQVCSFPVATGNTILPSSFRPLRSSNTHSLGVDPSHIYRFGISNWLGLCCAHRRFSLPSFQSQRTAPLLSCDLDQVAVDDTFFGESYFSRSWILRFLIRRYDLYNTQGNGSGRKVLQTQKPTWRRNEYTMNKGSRDSTGSSKASERSRWPPLTRMLMSGEMSGERPKDLSTREQFDRWMLNEGYRRL